MASGQEFTTKVNVKSTADTTGIKVTREELQRLKLDANRIQTDLAKAGRFNVSGGVVNDVAGRLRAVERRAASEERAAFARRYLPGSESLGDGRGYVGSGFGRRTGEAQKPLSLDQSFKKDSKAIREMLGLGGAVAIADVLGRSMQSAAEEIGKFRERAKQGYGAMENFAIALSEALPGAGELAKGFAALRDQIGIAIGAEGWTGEQHQFNKTMRTRQEQQDREADARKVRDQRNAERGRVQLENREAAKEATRQLRLVGKDGLAREAIEKQNELAKELERIAKERTRVKGWGDAGLEVQKQLDVQEQAARAKYDDWKRQQDRTGGEAIRQQQYGISERVAGMRAQSRQEYLRRSVGEQAAELSGVDEEARKAVAEAMEKERQAKFAGGYEALNAERVRAQEVAAIEERKQAQITEINAKWQRTRETQEREHQNAIAGQRNETMLAFGKTVGMGVQVERAALAENLRKSLAEIQEQARKQIAENPADAANINRRAADQARGAMGRYGVDALGLEMDLRERYRIGAAPATSGETRLMTGIEGDPYKTQSLAYAREQKQLTEQLKASVESLTQVFMQFIPEARAFFNQLTGATP